MRTLVSLGVCFSLATSPVISRAQQVGDAQQGLQGLLTGDRVRDRGLIEAFQRGYQRGIEQAERQCKIETAKIVNECKKQR